MLSSDWHVMLKLNCFQDTHGQMAKISDLGDPLGHRPQKGEKSCLMFTIMQNFTPIGATVDKISVTGERNKAQKPIYTSIVRYVPYGR